MRACEGKKKDQPFDWSIENRNTLFNFLTLGFFADSIVVNDF